eukprot:CAMPEP_0201702890 /NCGR_PEP_ID=MMETSP0578-20130828/38033_1 /ASSEMBLY_ACC=CAM_ASM_000663 /TAXON_ID=267565 /ORGANISM="Skeletonema grethea, Strain CCMP 1804" /LENGTH=784 /DNA_ID=CAMNT_0048190561 /DNA_START=37 /DNA_END=2392 /DNA_ORIENTATION=+
MSSLFDVDCPRTPDGDSQEEHTPRQQTKKVPSMAPSRPPRISRKSSRSRTSSSRSRSTPRRVGGGLEPATPRRVGGGLEPEEYIAPSFIRDPSFAPSSGNAPINNRNRAFSAEMTGGSANGVPRAPSSGPSRYVPPAPSSGPSAYTVSPRVAPKSGGNEMHGSHPRTNSGDWWKEEIVDENEDKDAAMNQHYGSSIHQHHHQQLQQQQQQFYGKSATNPFETENQHFGNPATRRLNDINQNEDSDAEQGLNARDEAGRVLAAVDNRNNHGDNLNSSLYDQANQMRHAGYYHNDDYSFNQMGLSDVPMSPRSPRDVGTPPRYRERKANVRNNLLPKWFAGFSSGRFQSGGLSPYVTSETNIAPRGSSTASSSSEWISNSPKVTFDTFNPNGVRKRGIAGHWQRLSPAKKVSVGVILVALMCTIMGVAVSETKKSYAAREQAALALAMANQPTPSPTSEPTNVPSLAPTDHPTRNPISRSPVAGNIGLHGKDSDGTSRPTRFPTTATPTLSPESKPSGSPTNPLSPAPTAAATSACTDKVGMFKNHLDNLKTCDWLNKEPGFSDRKNKNCGTQWPDGSVFPVTELGANCQSTCSLYNSCGLMNARTQEFEYERPLPATSEMLCEDQDGLFKNHIDNPKDCAWLGNGKAGHTDRKSKNCGWGPNLITELGWNCPQTCIWYNKSGCWDPADANSVAGMSIRASAAESTTSGEDSSTACIDGSGAYENQKVKINLVTGCTQTSASSAIVATEDLILLNWEGSAPGAVEITTYAQCPESIVECNIHIHIL